MVNRVYKYNLGSKILSVSTKEEADQFVESNHTGYFSEGIPSRLLERDIIVQIYITLYFTDNSLDDLFEILSREQQDCIKSGLKELKQPF